MAKDHFLDLMESAEDMWLAGWRCLNCGNVLDPVMERNRLQQGVGAAVSTVQEPVQKMDRVSVPSYVSWSHQVDHE
jgi:hypothetical protein